MENGDIGSLAYQHEAGTALPPAPDETLVSDPRAGLSPAQLVERKLVLLLPGTPLPMSWLQAARPRGPRP